MIGFSKHHRTPLRQSVGNDASFAPLPRGARDRLPDACRIRRNLIARLLECFESWGYEPVTTPAVEYYEVVARGLTSLERARCVKFIDASAGELLALRSDVTPQIARMVAQRGDELRTDVPLRLCYAADVVRQPEGRREQSEHHQAGVELLGDGSPEADAELIVLCHEALQSVGLRDLQIDLAHVGIARELVHAAALGEGDTAELLLHIGRKDPESTRRFGDSCGIERVLLDGLVGLCDLYGNASTLAPARRLLVGSRAEPALERLAQVVVSLRDADPELAERVTLDFGEVRGFDYYTGQRLRVWARGASEPIVRGGRYDDLLGRYGKKLCATGFAIELDLLEAALALHTEPGDRSSAREAVLVAIDGSCPRELSRAHANELARAERALGARAWVERDVDLASAKRIASARRAARIVFLRPGAKNELERDVFCVDGSGWRSVTDQRGTKNS